MKKRIDVLLVEKGYFESRERAKKAIMAGVVFVNNQRCDKAGVDVDEDADILVKGDPIPYVSRGGLKLEKAMKNFDYSASGYVLDTSPGRAFYFCHDYKRYWKYIRPVRKR